MKRPILFLLFYILTVQVIVCQSPVECKDDSIIIIYESQSSDINLEDCGKDLLITTIDNNVEITGSILINENFTTHIIPTEMYKINLKPGYSQKTETGKIGSGNGSDEGEDKDDDIYIYPNPVDNILKIKTKETVISYIISNVYGAVKLQGNTPNNNTIDTTSLQTGLYYINIQTPTETVTISFYKL